MIRPMFVQVHLLVSGVKRGGIFQPRDSEVARKLRKNDWVNEEVYITPSTHRIFTKEPQKVGNKEAYVMSDDESFVFMHPKAQVGSSGILKLVLNLLFLFVAL